MRADLRIGYGHLDDHEGRSQYFDGTMAERLVAHDADSDPAFLTNLADGSLRWIFVSIDVATWVEPEAGSAVVDEEDTVIVVEDDR